MKFAAVVYWNRAPLGQFVFENPAGERKSFISGPAAGREGFVQLAQFANRKEAYDAGAAALKLAGVPGEIEVRSW